ncbi:MAG: aminotransferase class I/II-fold pyridoxal phosphate-dependent enzyme, partial [Alphaproteobacteria bacterium]
MQLGKSLAAMPSSGIRDTFNRIAGMPDVINLAPGEPNFPTPPHIVEAASRALEAGHTKYISNAGLLELRERLSRKLRSENGIAVDSDEIVVTHGAMGALYSAFVGLVEPGDEVLLPDPAWPNFTMMATLRSAAIRNYRLGAENGFLPDIDELEALVGPATKLLLINTPLNPIGSVIPRARMAALLDFAAAHDLWLVCDEAYEALTYTASFVSAASFNHRERVIGVYSFSKTYAMTGWRIGYMVVPRDIATVLADLQEAMISCA